MSKTTYPKAILPWEDAFPMAVDLNRFVQDVRHAGTNEYYGIETYFNLSTDQAEAIGLAQYLATCDDDEYVEYFEMHGIELGSQ